MLGAMAIWIGIVSGIVIIAGGVVGAYRWLLRRGKTHDVPPTTSTTAIMGPGPGSISGGIQVFRGPVTINVHVDGLPDAKDPRLRAIFERGRKLQEEGEIAQTDDKHRQAIEAFSAALALAEDDAQRAALHILSGNSHLAISDYPSAQHDYEEALRNASLISASNESAETRAAALGNLGLVQMDLGHLQAAEDFLRQSLKLDMEMGNLRGQAETLVNLGIILSQRGNSDEAERLLRESLPIHEKASNWLGEASALVNLGIVLAEGGDLDKAEETFEIALAVHEQMGSRLGAASVLGDLGNVYLMRDDLDGAQSRYEKALTIDTDIGSKKGEAQDLGNLANVYKLRGMSDEAEQYAKRALEISTDVGYRSGQADNLARLGAIYGLRQEFKAAKDCLQRARDLYQQIGINLQRYAPIDQALYLIEQWEHEQEQTKE